MCRYIVHLATLVSLFKLEYRASRKYGMMKLFFPLVGPVFHDFLFRRPEIWCRNIWKESRKRVKKWGKLFTLQWQVIFYEFNFLFCLLNSIVWLWADKRDLGLWLAVQDGKVRFFASPLALVSDFRKRGRWWISAKEFGCVNARGALGGSK